MPIVKIHHAKTHLSRLIEKACEGEEIIIARGNEPLVRLQPLRGKTGQRKPGSMKGILKVGPEFFEPLPEDELKSWE
jgi:antitoxin (DNA-binding transcriptional repressor) of toxin-antitoxin stability system